MFKPTPIVCALFLLAASGCGTLGNYNDRPALTLSGVAVPDTPARAVQDLFMSRSTPYRIAVFEADPDTGQPIEGEAGMSALGVGGLFLPLVYDLNAIDIAEVETTEDGVAFVADLRSEVNLIPTWQGRVRGTVTADDQGIVRLKLRPYYANWVIIGNVIAGGKLALDRIDLAEDRFTGYYSVSFFGTGNAIGSGYFEATLGEIPETP
ncbi:MAG: hypothetical protein AAGE65_05650 [Planctomycetota bacterium]